MGSSSGKGSVLFDRYAKLESFGGWLESDGSKSHPGAEKLTLYNSMHG